VRSPLDRDRLLAVLRALARACLGPGTIFITGGGTALLYGWRRATVDIDLKLDPEPAGAFEAIARVKEELDANIELASPEMFVPQLPDWREHSALIENVGVVEIRHYDLRAQALAKLARGFERDLHDVAAMRDRELISCDELRRAYAAIEPQLVRYPRVSARDLGARIDAICPPVTFGSTHVGS
jgi:hypothetical protein